MSLLALCEQIQNSALSQAISQSTWGYPAVGALHVLAIALSGGAVIANVRWLKRVGLAAVLATGVLLFAAGAVQYYNSTAFRIKLLLLVLILVNEMTRARRPSVKMLSILSLVLWAAVIFASRGIAFF